MVVNGAGLKLSSALIIAAIIVLCAAPAVWPQENNQMLAPGAVLPSAQTIESCMSRKEGAECLDNLFRDTLKTHSTLDALQLIQRLEKEDPDIRRECHPIVHAIGRETFRVKGNLHDSFTACD